MFFDETNNVEQVKGIFADNPGVEQNSRKLLHKLNNIFHKFLKKIRITGNRNRNDDTTNMKTNKLSNHIGLINEIFTPGCIGDGTSSLTSQSVAMCWPRLHVGLAFFHIRFTS